MSSTFRIVPLIPGLVNEVALEIFLYFVAIDRDGPSTLVLVCTAWRDAVLGSNFLQSLRRKRRRPNPALGENRDKVEEGICIMSFDGGGPGSMSQLRMLEEFMLRLAFESDVEVDELRPADYFDLMGGVGFGGFVALLLGRLRMTTSQAMKELTTIGSETFPKGDEMTITEVPMARLRTAIESMLERNGHSVGMKLRNTSDSRCKVVLFAAATEAMDHCHPFRTYRSPRKCLECTFVDAACATMATPGYFPSVSIGPRLRKQNFAGIPHNFHNPMREVLKEARLVFGEKNPVSLMLSLGAGQPARHSSLDHQVTLRSRIHCDGVARDLQDQLHGFAEYLRLNVDKGMENIELDNWHELGSIETHTNVYLEMNQITGYIDRAVQLLLQRNGSVTLGNLSGRSADCVVKSYPESLEKYLAMEFKQMSDVIRGLGIEKVTLVDAIGNNIPIPKHFCPTYAMLLDVIKVYFRHQNPPGSDLVERGDYRLLHGRRRSIVDPVEWDQIEKVRLKVEMSMILRTRNGDKARCPRCRTRSEAPPTNGWVTCVSCSGQFEIEDRLVEYEVESGDDSHDEEVHAEENSIVTPAVEFIQTSQGKLPKKLNKMIAKEEELKFRLISVVNLLNILSNDSSSSSFNGTPAHPVVQIPPAIAPLSGATNGHSIQSRPGGGGGDMHGMHSSVPTSAPASYNSFPFHRNSSFLIDMDLPSEASSPMLETPTSASLPTSANTASAMYKPGSAGEYKSPTSQPQVPIAPAPPTSPKKTSIGGGSREGEPYNDEEIRLIEEVIREAVQTNPDIKMAQLVQLIHDRDPTRPATAWSRQVSKRKQAIDKARELARSGKSVANFPIDTTNRKGRAYVAHSHHAPLASRGYGGEPSMAQPRGAGDDYRGRALPQPQDVEMSDPHDQNHRNSNSALGRRGSSHHHHQSGYPAILPPPNHPQLTGSQNVPSMLHHPQTQTQVPGSHRKHHDSSRRKLSPQHSVSPSPHLVRVRGLSPGNVSGPHGPSSAAGGYYGVYGPPSTSRYGGGGSRVFGLGANWERERPYAAGGGLPPVGAHPHPPPHPDARGDRGVGDKDVIDRERDESVTSNDPPIAPFHLSPPTSLLHSIPETIDTPILGETVKFPANSASSSSGITALLRSTSGHAMQPGSEDRERGPPGGPIRVEDEPREKGVRLPPVPPTTSQQQQQQHHQHQGDGERRMVHDLHTLDDYEMRPSPAGQYGAPTYDYEQNDAVGRGRSPPSPHVPNAHLPAQQHPHRRSERRYDPVQDERRPPPPRQTSPFHPVPLRQTEVSPLAHYDDRRRTHDDNAVPHNAPPPHHAQEAGPGNRRRSGRVPRVPPLAKHVSRLIDEDYDDPNIRAADALMGLAGASSMRAADALMGLAGASSRSVASTSTTESTTSFFTAMSAISE